MIDLRTAPDELLHQALALNAAVRHWASPLDLPRLPALLGPARAPFPPIPMARDPIRLHGPRCGGGPEHRSLGPGGAGG